MREKKKRKCYSRIRHLPMHEPTNTRNDHELEKANCLTPINRQHTERLIQIHSKSFHEDKVPNSLSECQVKMKTLLSTIIFLSITFPGPVLPPCPNQGY